MNTGNIVKLYGGSLVIITRIDTNITHWISFDSSGCSGATKNKTFIEDAMCWTCGINDGGDIEYDCECCKGTGYYKKTIHGMDKAKVLADNVKEYIVKRLTKNFEF